MPIIFTQFSKKHNCERQIADERKNRIAPKQKPMCLNNVVLLSTHVLIVSIFLSTEGADASETNVANGDMMQYSGVYEQFVKRGILKDLARVTNILNMIDGNLATRVLNFVQNLDGATMPLHLAAHLGKVEMVKFLRIQGNNHN